MRGIGIDGYRAGRITPAKPFLQAKRFTKKEVKEKMGKEKRKKVFISLVKLSFKPFCFAKAFTENASDEKFWR